MKKSVTAVFLRPFLITAFAVIASVIFISSGAKNDKNAALPFLSNVDKVVEDQMTKQEIYGCAVAVVENGKIVHVKAYGHYDRLRKKPISTSTVFRWASISKPLTAVTAFKAIEANKLSLTDKVSKHVSYWPKTGNKDSLKVSHLLNNRGGVNQYTNIQKSKYKS